MLLHICLTRGSSTALPAVKAIWPKENTSRYWKKSSIYQLRLVVYHTIYRVFAPSQVVVWDFWTIKSINKRSFSVRCWYSKGLSIKKNKDALHVKRRKTATLQRSRSPRMEMWSWITSKNNVHSTYIYIYMQYKYTCIQSVCIYDLYFVGVDKIHRFKPGKNCFHWSPQKKWIHRHFKHSFVV